VGVAHGVVEEGDMAQEVAQEDMEAAVVAVWLAMGMQHGVQVGLEQVKPLEAVQAMAVLAMAMAAMKVVMDLLQAMVVEEAAMGLDPVGMELLQEVLVVGAMVGVMGTCTPQDMQTTHGDQQELITQAHLDQEVQQVGVMAWGQELQLQKVQALGLQAMAGAMV
jgi:hypothetical protein